MMKGLTLKNRESPDFSRGECQLKRSEALNLPLIDNWFSPFDSYFPVEVFPLGFVRMALRFRDFDDRIFSNHCTTSKRGFEEGACCG